MSTLIVWEREQLLEVEGGWCLWGGQGLRKLDTDIKIVGKVRGFYVSSSLFLHNNNNSENIVQLCCGFSSILASFPNTRKCFAYDQRRKVIANLIQFKPHVL